MTHDQLQAQLEKGHPVVGERPMTDDEYWAMALAVAIGATLMRDSPYRRRLPFYANLARLAAGEFDGQLKPLVEQLKKGKI